MLSLKQMLLWRQMLRLTDWFNYQMIDLSRVSCNLLLNYLLLTYGETFRGVVTCRKQVVIKQCHTRRLHELFVKLKPFPSEHFMLNHIFQRWFSQALYTNFNYIPKYYYVQNCESFGIRNGCFHYNQKSISFIFKSKYCHHTLCSNVKSRLLSLCIKRCLKVHQRWFENLTICLCSYKNSTLNISNSYT